MSGFLVFILCSLLLAWLSRHALISPSFHGFYRFFAWESILGLVLLNFSAEAADIYSTDQILSSFFLLVSLGLALYAAALLIFNGKPTLDRQDRALFRFEKTSLLVTKGVFKYIRHPMYTSLFLLALGEFFKDVSWVGICLASCAGGFLYLAAKMEEAESLAYFGEAYESYMRKTKRFIPFVF